MPPGVTVLRVAADAMTPEVRAGRDALFAAVFRGGADPRRVWAAPHEHWFLLRDGEMNGTMIGHVGVHRRVIAHAGRQFAVAGVAKVGLLPGERGGGLGSLLLRRVQDDLRAAGQDDLGLLVTSENRLGYYGRLGWQRVRGPVTYDYHGEPRIESFPVLLLPLRLDDAASALWLCEPIDLAGPFW